MKLDQFLREMPEEEFNDLNNILASFIKNQLRMNFEIKKHYINRINQKGADTPHDRAARNYTYVGADISKTDVLRTFKKLFAMKKNKLIGYAQSPKEIEICVYDPDNDHLGMIIAIQPTRNLFKIVTMHKKTNFKPVKPGTKYFVL